MEEVSISLDVLLKLLAFIITLGGAITVLTRWFAPYKTLKEKVNKHEELLDNDNKRLQEIEEDNKMLCKCMLALLDHEITGNSTEKLKKTRKEVEEYLINKK